MFTLEQATNIPDREQRNGSTISLTPALDRGGPSTPRSGLFTPVKETRSPFVQEAGWAPGLVWTGAEIRRPHRI
jgi:hypothetical protein